MILLFIGDTYIIYLKEIYMVSFLKFISETNDLEYCIFVQV
jgi:hypothetical protein